MKFERVMFYFLFHPDMVVTKTRRKKKRTNLKSNFMFGIGHQNSGQGRLPPPGIVNSVSAIWGSGVGMVRVCLPNNTAVELADVFVLKFCICWERNSD